MSTWLQAAINRAELIQDALAPQRQASLALLKSTVWPTRKTEAWKYTSLRAFESLAGPESLPAADRTAIAPIPNLATHDLVFIDGQFNAALSCRDLPAGLPAGLRVRPLTDSATALFNQIKPQRHFFGLVNDVLAQQGVVVEIAANANLATPIRIVHHYTSHQESHTRHLIQLGDQAIATVIEQFVGNTAAVATQFSEYKVGAGAQLTHCRFGLQTESSVAIGGAHFELATKSNLHSTLVGFGSQLSRLDVDVRHAGEQARATVNAIYLLQGDELFDLHSTIEHAVPQGTTVENVRGIVADSGKAVFNGRIHIHRHAQKTQAELNNRNLLLSKKAEVDTKPELEIYADDVRCAHGATIAQLDEKALYYLQSRGIAEQQARVMLSFGFINELVEQIPLPLVATWLESVLRARFVIMQPAVQAPAVQALEVQA